MAQNGSYSRSWELNYSDQWAKKYVNLFSWIEDKTFANDFLRLFDISFQKNVKSHVFLKFEKKRKIRILEH